MEDECKSMYVMGDVLEAHIQESRLYHTVCHFTLITRCAFQESNPKFSWKNYKKLSVDTRNSKRRIVSINLLTSDAHGIWSLSSYSKWHYYLKRKWKLWERCLHCTRISRSGGSAKLVSNKRQKWKAKWGSCLIEKREDEVHNMYISALYQCAIWQPWGF